MWTVIRSSLRGHVRRLVSIGLAVCIGVAFLSGTLILGDTLRDNFDRLFANAFGRTDVVVRSANTLTTEVEAVQALIDGSLADRLRAVEGVRAVEPRIEGFGQLTGADGEKLGGEGPPTLAGSWIDDDELNPYKLVEGRAPQGPNEVVINRGAAKDGELRVGSATMVATPEPVPVTVVGIATFGDEDGLGPTTFAGFSLAGAEQHITGRPGQVTSLLVAGDEGVDAAALRDAIAAALPAGVEAITGAELVAESTADIDAEFLGFLRGFLNAFAAIALLVATFSIYNTFSIVVAQRVRQTALLRAVGAGRGQLLASVLLEGLLVGVAASAIGVPLGFGLAGLLKGLFDAFGFGLPAGGLTLGPSIVVAPVVGIAVTVGAGIGPALRASRVAPLAALRGVEVDHSGASRRRAVIGAVLLALGVAATALGGSLGVMGIGAVMTIVGTVVLGPVGAAPAAAALGRVLGRLRGVTGAMAGRNAARSPRRTAGTASALLIGVGVVAVFTVVAASLRTSIDRRVEDVITSDLLITSSQFGGGGMSPGLAAALEDVPEVDTAVGVATGPVSIGGRTSQATIAAPDGLAGHVDAAVGNGFSVSDVVAEDRGWSAGDIVDVVFPDGAVEPLVISAVYETADPLLSGYVVPRDVWNRHAVQTIDNRVLITLNDGVSIEDGRRAVEQAAAPFAPPDVQTKAEYVESAMANLDAMLGLIYVMLALAIVIAVMGIANTLSLSIHERTRELGLLRAVGQTRRQLRSMVRWESVVIALVGALAGIGLGVFLGWGAIGAMGSRTIRFAAPAGQLVPIVVLGLVAGVVASLGPARRAARLPVLEAVADR